VRVRLRVNGSWVEVDVEPHETLLNVLRDRLRIRSVKYGCGIGECGSCTVLLNGRPVTSCLVLAAGLDGASVETADYLAKTELGTRIVNALLLEGAIQCGYCTPGFLVTIYAALRSGMIRRGDSTEIARAISGNICRCTGYVNIVKAVKRVVAELAATGTG
jgi:carbon-monoxide dehydrogenase small subunit